MFPFSGIHIHFWKEKFRYPIKICTNEQFCCTPIDRVYASRTIYLWGLNIDFMHVIIHFNKLIFYAYVNISIKSGQHMPVSPIKTILEHWIPNGSESIRIPIHWISLIFTRISLASHIAKHRHCFVHAFSFLQYYREIVYNQKQCVNTKTIIILRFPSQID